MSFDPPSGPPPSGPPPGETSETLESHGGAPQQGGRSRRTTVLASVGAVGVLAAGGATWAAWSFFSTGAQPAEALPASTVAYASIDLDPSGGQKIAALRTLSKFPAFEDVVGLDADDDVRRWIFDRAAAEAGCDGLDYDDDVAPWLGDRFAAAAVDTGADGVVPAVVLQVTDEGAAGTGLDALSACGGDDIAAWSIRDGWAVLAETQELADGIAGDAAEGSLADDDDFRHWTDEAGDSGIVSMYAAPEVGDFLAEDLGVSPGAEVLEGFAGAAATLRFDDGGVELEVVSDTAAAGAFPQGDQAGDLVASLPEDTVAAFGLSMGEGWFDEVLGRLGDLSGEAPDELIAEASEELGIDLPDDAETLAGDALALAIGADFDPELGTLSPGALESEPSIGAGVKIHGDPAGIEGVLDKVRAAAAGELGSTLDSDAGDDVVAVGPDAAYRERLLDDGGLGDTDAFQGVVEHSDAAGAVLYVDVDGSKAWLTDLWGDDPEVRDNLEPLDALGLSTWQDGDTSHAVLKVTTD
ncbi:MULTISPECIES: hypothetical protein [unclassified Nocardioides]|uniref:hypothetical protein n=1 Tax=unclassified Nocardioides TaxID=2615069 RepID=UPI003619E601